MRRERTHNTKVEPGFVKRRNRINEAFSRQPLSENIAVDAAAGRRSAERDGAGP